MHTDEANYQGSYPYMVEEHYSMGTIPDGASRSNYYGTNRGTTIRVDSLTPNAYGVYNMNGNVSEWCFDYYAAYDTSDTTDPAGAKSVYSEVRWFTICEGTWFTKSWKNRGK